MPESNRSNFPSEISKKIKLHLINIFKDIYFNSPNILRAKDESDSISKKIKDFIIGYINEDDESEVDLFIKAKEKGLELISNHALIFFSKKVSEELIMKAFLIPGIKIDPEESDSDDLVTEEDLESIDHELCISFKTNKSNLFVKLDNLIDIRATLAKDLSNKATVDKVVNETISNNKKFKQSLKETLIIAEKVFNNDVD